MQYLSLGKSGRRESEQGKKDFLHLSTAVVDIVGLVILFISGTMLDPGENLIISSTATGRSSDDLLEYLPRSDRVKYLKIIIWSITVRDRVHFEPSHTKELNKMCSR